jgi:sarcosine oxidase subunit beta
VSGFKRTGFVLLVNGKDHDGLMANMALQCQVGIHSEMLSLDSLRELMPCVETFDLIEGAYEPEGGYADPYLTVNAYARAARRSGARLYLDMEVVGIRFRRDRVVGVNTDKGGLDAPLVLNTAGAWAARVAGMAGANLPISPCRVQVALFRRPPGHEAPHPVVADFVNAIYFRSETGGLTLVGLADPGMAKAVLDPDNYSKRMDSAFVLDAGGRLVCRYPAMDLSESSGGYASLYGITPDWHPIVDQVPAGSGFYVCAGFSGHGFKLGPAAGVMVADMLTAVPEPESDPYLFRLGRFEEDHPVRGQYEYSIVG